MRNTSSLPAIPARKSRLGAELTYYATMAGALWNSFDGVYFSSDGLPPTPADGPLIFCLNHPSWWDGHLCMLIHRLVLQSAFDSYMMVEEAQLRRYRFFTYVGAFSVDRHRPREAARSIAYVAGLLREQSNRACWIFPQGEITPNDRRPLVVYPGVAHIVRRVGSVTICPIALRYELRGEQRPDAFVRLGPTQRVGGEAVDVPTLTAQLAGWLTASADRLRDDVLNSQLDGYSRLMHGRPGINRVFDQLLFQTVPSAPNATPDAQRVGSSE